MNKKINLLLLFLFAGSLQAQTLNVGFTGWWARTQWTYTFKNNGTYKFTSTGHGGGSNVSGTYTQIADTVRLLTGNPTGERDFPYDFVLDEDSMLVDLQLFYDYAPLYRVKKTVYNSKSRFEYFSVAHPGESVFISQEEFDEQVKKYTEMLKAKKLEEISDEDHIAIIRTANTIFRHRVLKRTPPLTGGIYEAFEAQTTEVHYKVLLPTVYTDWVPNKGMGYYFEKLEVELGGSPGVYSYYQFR